MVLDHEVWLVIGELYMADQPQLPLSASPLSPVTAFFLREITFIRDGLTDEGWRYQICQIVFSQPNSIVQVCRTRREAALCLAFQDLHTQN